MLTKHDFSKVSETKSNRYANEMNSSAIVTCPPINKIIINREEAMSKLSINKIIEIALVCKVYNYLN